MAKPQVFRCEILTPGGIARSLQVIKAIFPALDGLMGVLHGRAPFVAAMGAGLLALESNDGQLQEYFVAGGFARMNEDVLTIMAEVFSPLETLDPQVLWAEIQEARKLPAETPAQIAMREETLETARIKFRLVQERREKPRINHQE